MLLTIKNKCIRRGCRKIHAENTFIIYCKHKFIKTDCWKLKQYYPTCQPMSGWDMRQSQSNVLYSHLCISSLYQFFQSKPLEELVSSPFLDPFSRIYKRTQIAFILSKVTLHANFLFQILFCFEIQYKYFIRGTL